MGEMEVTGIVLLSYWENRFPLVFMQLLPTGKLSGVIKHYLFLHNTNTEGRKLRLFSDGNSGIGFTLKGRLFSNSTSFDYLPGSFLYGQISEFRDIYALGEMSMIIAVFHPDGLHKLLGLPGYELFDRILDLELILGKKCRILQEKLSIAKSEKEQANLLDSFFIGSNENFQPTFHSPIRLMLDLIYKHNGLAFVKQLSQLNKYSERQIERIFQECIGLSPKKFGNTVRLHYFLSLLKKQEHPLSLTSLSYEAGYADQSHLNREFKKLTGITPFQYLYKSNKLAVNFIQSVPDHLL
jgi:AraC-like DNA-binding protein